MTRPAATQRAGREVERAIFCCACGVYVDARLTSGAEVYPHRPDLAPVPFWRCPQCHNWVGCHHKTAQRTKPLGTIPDAAMKQARRDIHALIDPLWQTKMLSRRHLYARLTSVLGRQYHTAELRTLDEAWKIHRAAAAIRAEVAPTLPSAKGCR